MANPNLYPSILSFPLQLQIPSGVLDLDEMKVNDCVEILTAHDKYLPRTNSGDPIETLMCGDGLSCKGVRDAQRIRQTGGNRMRKLSGYIPAAQPKTSTSKPTTPADNAESQPVA